MAATDSHRARAIASTTRVVVKVGSRLLADIPGETRELRIRQLVDQLHALREAGYEVILVTSGAIATGMLRLGLSSRPTDLPVLQAMAAVGQAHLMTLYERACTAHDFHSAQILITADDVRDRKRHLNIRNTLHALLQRHILPIINENDTVSIDEIGFGDNDQLAALVASMMRADLTILLTTVDGLRHREADGSLGHRLSELSGVDDELRAMASGTDGNPFSRGGMATKLDAARICLASGEYCWIADGTDFSVLARIIDGADVGTLFVPDMRRMTGQKRWLAFFADPSGAIRVDAGAAMALLAKGKSLLPTGITALDGDFDKGDTVTVLDDTGTEIAVGVTNYSAADLARIKGQHTSKIDEILGHSGYSEVIHRNNMAMLGGSAPIVT